MTCCLITLYKINTYYGAKKIWIKKIKVGIRVWWISDRLKWKERLEASHLTFHSNHMNKFMA